MASAAPPLRAIALLGLLMLLWGTNWSIFRIALDEIPLWTFRSVTIVCAATLLFAVALARGERMAVPRHLWGPLLIASLMNLTIWNVATAVAVMHIPSGHAAMLAYTMPLWTALLSSLFLGVRFSARMGVALALGAASVALLMGPNFAIYAGAPIGMLAGLGAGLAWAIGTIVVKRTDWSDMGLTFTAWQVALSAPPILLGAVLFDGGGIPDASWLAWGTTIYIGLVPMAIGTATWFAIVGLLPMQAAALSSVAVPMVAMASGILVHREPLGPVQIAAIACAVAALWLALMPARAAKPA